MTHFYEPRLGHGLAHDPFGSIVGPRPIGWISSQSADGVLNLAPYSFFNAFNYAPPIIGFASLGYKDTASNVEATGEFCWSLATRPLIEQVNASAASVDASVSEFDLAGLTPGESKVVSVPHVLESPVSFECRRTDVVRLRSASGSDLDTWLVLGEVVGVHIASNLVADGIYRTADAEPVLRGGGPTDYFAITPENLFHMVRPS